MRCTFPYFAYLNAHLTMVKQDTDTYHHSGQYQAWRALIASETCREVETMSPNPTDQRLARHDAPLVTFNPGIIDETLSLPIDEAVAVLCDSGPLDQVPGYNGSYERELLAKAHATLDAALRYHDEAALHQIHRALFLLYDLHVADAGSPRAEHQFDPLLTRLRREIERRWLDTDISRFAHVPRPADSDELVAALKRLWSEHPASCHPLFDFLEKEASKEQIIAFFTSDSALNIRFFDLLLFSMVGSRIEVRKELAQNFWDESGRGEPARSHVTLFRRLLDSVGVGQAVDNHAAKLDWQGLAGYNLFMLTALNRRHYFKLLGILAMTELLDPPQYEKLARGCRRVGLGTANELEYYDEHVTIDVVHGEGWLMNVIVPIVEQTPSASADILVGARLRLQSCAGYYDALYAKLNALR
jgi:hypothetical protein